jgi:hypothetical protein
MNEISKFELQAAIERLIESGGNDAGARDILASYATKIKSDGGASLDISTQSRGGGFSGATPESGEVKIDLDSGHKRQWSFGENSDRIGYYKVSRKTTRSLLHRVKEERIIVSHFWKADLSTESDTEEPEAWCLSCDANMIPVWFGTVVSVELFRLGQLSVVLREIHETWGPNVGSTHPQDVQVKARLDI